jgi:hypothetical protein
MCRLWVVFVQTLIICLLSLVKQLHAALGSGFSLLVGWLLAPPAVDLNLKTVYICMMRMSAARAGAPLHVITQKPGRSADPVTCTGMCVTDCSKHTHRIAYILIRV